MVDFKDGTSKTVSASELRAGRDDALTGFVAGAPGADYRGHWAGGVRASGYLHVNTPNSSAPECYAPHMCGDPGLATAPCSGSCSYQGFSNTARSYHPGGVNVAFRDGHVAFYTDDVNIDLWQALSSIDGRESVSE